MLLTYNRQKTMNAFDPQLPPADAIRRWLAAPWPREPAPVEPIELDHEHDAPALEWPDDDQDPFHVHA